MTVEVAEVQLWGTRVGAVRWDPDRGLGNYEYDPAFLRSGIELAPLTMPLGPGIRSFPALSRETFKGLPGMLADSLPDKFGTALIDAWLVRQGRPVDDFNPVERLCYVGSRGLGALEFAPAIADTGDDDAPLDVAELVSLAQKAIAPNAQLRLRNGDPGVDDLTKIIRVGTSAGGARAKAVIAWDEATNEIRSGQLDQPSSFTHWLIKFDGVDGNRDKELADPQGFGRVEFAYSQMARAAGVRMPETRLLEESGRAHFMTRRFDRTPLGRLHQQSLTAVAHADFNLAGGYSYEQALRVMRQIGLPHPDLVEQVRRAFFNVVARNQDDHTKNISFLMDRGGRWSLSPAYDVTYSYNPVGAWTSAHQMTINGKRDGFARSDLVALGVAADLSPLESLELLDQVVGVVSQWRTFAAEAHVSVELAETVFKNLRLELPEE